MRKYFKILCILFLFSHKISAQDTTVNFTQQQLLAFEKQAIQSVTNFCQFLGDLASSETIAEYKPQLKKNIIRLFVPGAKVGVKSVSRPNKSTNYPISTYTDQVAGYSQKYNFIVLQFFKVRVDVRHLRDTLIAGKKYFYGTFSYWQRFLASNEEKESNNYTQEDFSKAGSDETKKTGKIYFQEFLGNSKSSRWKIFLGDIEAKEIRPLKK